VGEHLLGEINDQTRRMTTAMGGGVGLTLQELCGALSGGALIIGALHGRTSAEEDDSKCAQITTSYRERFLDEFGTTRCQEIRNQGFGKGATWPCSELVERATSILLQTLA
jgi:C_GCAxxG_C_C family probable redox protein